MKRFVTLFIVLMMSAAAYGTAVYNNIGNVKVDDVQYSATAATSTQKTFPNYSTLQTIGRGGTGGIAVDDVVTKGPWVDVRSAPFFGNASTAKVYAESVGKPLHITTPVTVNTLTFNCEVDVIRGGDITVNSSKTATYASDFHAGRTHYCLKGSGTHVVKKAQLYPGWWGAIADTGDNSTDNVTTATANAAAILKAIASASSAVGGTVRIDSLFYVGSSATSGTPNIINFNGYSDWSMDGGGSLKVMSNQRNTGAGRNLSGWNMLTASTAASRWSIRNITVDANGPNNLAWASSSPMTPLSWGAGNDITIEGVVFRDNPGRNTISGGWSNGPSLRVKVLNNSFVNFGGAIAGNETQNDHSSIYAVWDQSEITGNIFSNDNDFSTIGRDVCAIEEHMKTGVVSGNVVANIGIGIISSVNEATVTPGEGKIISNNTLRKVKKIGIKIHNGNNRTTVALNNISLYPESTVTSAVTGINLRRGINVIITSNNIETDTVSSRITEANINGIDIGSFNQSGYGNIDGLVISNNIIKNMGIGINGYLSYYDHSNFSFRSNDVIDFKNYGIKINSDVTGTLKNAFVQLNMVRSFESTVVNGIYFHKSGASVMDRVRYEGNLVEVKNQISAYGTTNPPTNVSKPPVAWTSASASDPTSGVWVVGQDIIYHSDPAAAGYIGRVPTVSGGAVAGTWATATAYAAGTWIKTSGNKVLECLTGGTSDATTEPAPSTLGATVTDGTVTWRYRANTLATFKTFGAISP